jgi:outer membrane protein OmpU
MKTLLLASTALVATAGFAAADVKISGWAEIGVLGGDKYATDQWHTDIDVNFAMTGESDGGLAFGASVDLDENGAFNNRTQGGETYFLSYGAMRLDMGDTDGALDKVMKEVNVAAGSIADDETSHAGFNGNAGLDGTFDGQIATVSYSASGFTGAISAEIDDSGVQTPVWGVGVRYATDLGGAAIGVGLGYQTQEDTADLVGVSLDAKFGGGFSAAINYTQADIVGGPSDASHMAIGVGYSMNALAVGVNYGEYTDWTLGCGDCSGFGLAATYDLGGGLSAQFGYGDSDFGGGVDSNSYSLGLSMSF